MSGDDVKQIDCTEAAQRLWAYLDGELPAPSAAEMERHIRECGKCLGVSETQRSFLRTLQAMPGADGSVDALRERVQALLAAERARGNQH